MREMMAIVKSKMASTGRVSSVSMENRYRLRGIFDVAMSESVLSPEGASAMRVVRLRRSEMVIEVAS
jgi:hypothetical protein